MTELTRERVMELRDRAAMMLDRDGRIDWNWYAVGVDTLLALADHWLATHGGLVCGTCGGSRKRPVGVWDGYDYSHSEEPCRDCSDNQGK